MGPSQLPLKDIHLPDPIGWWPIASGWWILICIIVLIIVIGVWWWRRFKLFAARRCALREFKELKANQDFTSRERMEILSVLIRRACLSTFPREQTAGLSGRNWLNFLDRSLNDGRFSGDEGKILLEAPYRKDASGDFNAVFELCEDWIKALPPSTSSPK